MIAKRVDLWLVLLTGILFIRVISLASYPLADTTEARYGEIARVMESSGNWITPQIEPGVPFWAKPPLSFWPSALSIRLLGTSEFALRLPSFLGMLLVLFLTVLLARRMTDQRSAVIAAIVFISSSVGYITAGAVMTDPALLLSTTLVMVSFWIAMTDGSRCWGYLLFVALAIGLLAKGPIAWVLSGFPIVVWLTIERRWGKHCVYYQ